MHITRRRMFSTGVAVVFVTAGKKTKCFEMVKL